MKDESEYEVGDIHGQFIFNYRHPHIPDGQEAELLLRAFQRDFEVNGPSVARCVRTILAGWKRHRNHADPRVRRRFVRESESLGTTFPAAIWAMKWYYRGNPQMRSKMSELLRDLYREFGWKARRIAALGGPYLLWKTWREQQRLARGWTYEPTTFYDRNEFVELSDADDARIAERCQYVTPASCRGDGQAGGHPRNRARGHAKDGIPAPLSDPDEEPAYTSSTSLGS